MKPASATISPMNNYITITILSLFLTLHATPAMAAKPNFYDYRMEAESLEIQQIQEFHLQQAQEKLMKKQYAQAWGDLAFILCKIPNHHEALEEMMDLAPQLSKRDELSLYFIKAIKLFPDDQELADLYDQFSASAQK